MTNERMSTLDRGTLGLWRVANVIGWSLGALIVAIAVEYAADILFVDVLDAAIDVVTDGAVVPFEIAATVTALLVGAAIGAVIGSRVYRWQIPTAVAVTLVYLLAWPFATVMLGRNGWWIALSVVLHLASAILAARFMLTRRRKSRG